MVNRNEIRLHITLKYTDKEPFTVMQDHLMDHEFWEQIDGRRNSAPEGVPLTTDLLEKLKFKWNGAVWVHSCCNFKLIQISAREFLYEDGVSMNDGRSMRYLHQIQNLYHAIMLEEFPMQ